MIFVLQPWQLLLATLAGWSSRQQQEDIEYLRTENQALKKNSAIAGFSSSHKTFGCGVEAGASCYCRQVDSRVRISTMPQPTRRPGSE